MTDKKLTDSEVVKALECCCITHACSKCLYSKEHTALCITDVMRDALDLINRLQAENEKLKSAINGFRGYEDKIKAEAYKEFAERLLLCYEDFDEINEVILLENLVKAIDDLLKEMVGEDNSNQVDK